jgi:hypothetical protein
MLGKQGGGISAISMIKFPTKLINMPAMPLGYSDNYLMPG